MGERQSGDGGGREFHRVAGELRTRMGNGTYPLHSMLPSQRNLADEFGVSRDTVQRVLRELAEAGWVESRQGSGSRVVRVLQATPAPVVAGRARGPITLGPALGKAFARPEVVLDTYTLTSESLYMHFSAQVERIRTGEIAPERIAVRMILPAEDLPLPFPRARDDEDDHRLRERLNGIQRRSLASLRDLFSGLELEEFVPSVSLEVRWARMAPSCKLYLIDHAEALLAPYEVIERNIRLDSGEVVPALDVLGFGASLTHHVKDEDGESPGSVFVDSWQAWFDSVWKYIAE
ncbi:winged helix-turn-helix domain-containing protein [Streptomyces sp. Tue 6430]|nr:winged helix-turn-helix domain-containing protein [Streptomyces sp. Tue 6430]